MPLLKKDVVEKLPTDLDGLQTTIKRLHDSLEQAHAYVDDVVVRCLAYVFLSYSVLINVFLSYQQFCRRW